MSNLVSSTYLRNFRDEHAMRLSSMEIEIFVKEQRICSDFIIRAAKAERSGDAEELARITADWELASDLMFVF